MVKGYGFEVLEGSWDLVSRVVSTLIRVISRYITIVTLIITLLSQSHDPLSKGFED